LVQVVKLRVALSTLGLAAALALAPPAAARDWTVEAVDWQFIPAHTTIDVGDSVTWRFAAAGHTSTSLGGQAESWNSAPSGTNPPGSTYTHVFTTPGRYQYVCIPHRDFMTGVIEVRGGDGAGSPTPVLASLRTKRMKRGVRLRFRLNTAARVTYRLKGPSRRTIRRGGLAPGEHTLRVRRLRRGAYRGVLTATDASGRRARRANSFRIR
jgi:plastocyanin